VWEVTVDAPEAAKRLPATLDEPIFSVRGFADGGVWRNVNR